MIKKSAGSPATMGSELLNKGDISRAAISYRHGLRDLYDQRKNLTDYRVARHQLAIEIAVQLAKLNTQQIEQFIRSFLAAGDGRQDGGYVTLKRSVGFVDLLRTHAQNSNEIRRLFGIALTAKVSGGAQ